MSPQVLSGLGLVVLHSEHWSKIFGKLMETGDQDFPVYHDKDVRRVIANGVAWVRSDRPEPALPTAPLRDRGLLHGHGYTTPIKTHDHEQADALAH